MNKKLIALAIAAALAPAAAMADSGNVSIYGIMDASYDITDNGNSTAGAAGIRTQKVSSNSSRLGFKGTEDVGNGLSAIWQIESQINADGNGLTSSATGGTTFGGRNTFLGLSSKTAGTVILGRHDTPYKLATRSLDYFGDGLADNRNLMGQGASYNLGATNFSFDGRQPDVVAYISPTMSGFHAAVAYVAGAELVTTSGQTKGNAWSAMGMYNNGPLMASLAYERHNIGSVGTGDITAGAANVDKSEKAWKLGVGYKIMPAFEVGFAYEKLSDDLNAGVKIMDHSAWTLGGKYSMGSNDLKLAYTKAGQRADVADTGAHQIALGLDHNLSKRTKVYAQYVKLSNDNAAVYGLTGAGATGQVLETGRAGADPSAWSFGMRHSF
ncbi:outer membrane protein (porin) [Sulfuricella denitrificans skB26]|uniref:Outer membrane protein (Porin) n=1 Tax=Sulfuricella denitrificans (strain DSM 22764 / NBRC 105220 / skB26) TaxID=1163617 RepID=S6AAX3_SULDS|nr:porin [Sulfuricella denitrificans]BAN36330.1 outer membrane protein (porin) [Sulfuricella denitrificans skB26]